MPKPKTKKAAPNPGNEPQDERLTQQDVRAAIRIIRKFLKGNDLRVAQYVLNLHYGNSPDEQEPQQNMSIDDDFFEKLTQKYFPNRKAPDQRQPEARP